MYVVSSLCSITNWGKREQAPHKQVTHISFVVVNVVINVWRKLQTNRLQVHKVYKQTIVLLNKQLVLLNIQIREEEK